ncbi:hypothetical protein CM15mP43_12080 [bacterium]|nr:MAG: hypothetical protein CM15mP43_12080 [bacterium]
MKGIALYIKIMMIFNFYVFKKLLLTEVSNVSKNIRKFVVYGLFNPMKDGSYISIELDIKKLKFYSDLQKYETKTFEISNYKIISESDKKLKIQYFINNNSYIMNSHVPFYGKTSENKIFINNIKKFLSFCKIKLKR